MPRPKMTRTHYNDAQMTDSNSLARAMLNHPAKLSPMLTFLGGRQDKKFPLTMLTEGVGNTKSIDNNEYEYGIQTRVTTTRPIVGAPSGGEIGKGGQPFTLTFPDRWFIKPYVLVSKSGTQARIMSEPRPNGGNYDYTLQLIDPDPQAYLPAEDVTPGSQFGMLFAPVGTDYSRGNASNWVSPTKIRHKLTTVRKSHQMSGRMVDHVVQVQLPNKGGGYSNLWMDYEEWQFMLQWKEECEMLYWYARQSYDQQGIVQMKDENGQPVQIGPGLLQQIINKDTYSRLTADKLLNTIGDLFYGMTDAQEKQVTLYTGTGGMREFDRAMKQDLGLQDYQVISDGKFVTGTGRNLTRTGYFKTYEHVDGHTINVVKQPLYDHSVVADTREKHPETGYSLESYRMVFVDNSVYEGENNVQMVNERGREIKRWAVSGSTTPRGFDQSTSRASDIDGASVHYLKSAGICLKRFDTSLDLQCVRA